MEADGQLQGWALSLSGGARSWFAAGLAAGLTVTERMARHCVMSKKTVDDRSDFQQVADFGSSPSPFWFSISASFFFFLNFLFYSSFFLLQFHFVVAVNCLRW